MKGCPLVASTFGTPGLCDWCGKDLPIVKRTGTFNPARRWCGPSCSGPYWASHQWNLARVAALKRDDYKCVRCGSDAGTRRGFCWYDKEPWPCKDAGQRFRHSWDDRYYKHSERIEVGKLEVNHKIPRKGAGYTNGCWHHLDDLETLCHDCHVKETTAQLREWKYPNAADPGPPREVEMPMPIWASLA